MTIIQNPRNALGQSGVDAAGVTEEYVASAAILRGQAVTAAVNNGRIEVAPATSAAGIPIGAAVEPAVPGAVVKVRIYGPALVVASSTNVAAGTAFSANANGAITTASTTLGQKAVGYMLEASGTTAGELKLAFISPSLTAAS